MQVALQRYREKDEGDDAAPWTEQERWEQEQLKRTRMAGGAMDAAAGQPQYDFVFEDQIEFIKDAMITGNLEEDEGERETPKEREARLRRERAQGEREQMAASRASLPVYPYRWVAAVGRGGCWRVYHKRKVLICCMQGP